MVRQYKQLNYLPLKFNLLMFLLWLIKFLVIKSQVQNGAVVNTEFLLNQIFVNFSFRTYITDTFRTL